MASTPRNRKWKLVEPHIAEARARVAKYDGDKVNPKDYSSPIPDDWNDLLKRM